MLREIIPVYKREMKSYFTSPAIYVAIALFLGFVGLNFYSVLGYFQRLSDPMMQQQMNMPLNLTAVVITGMSGFINFMMVFIVPVLTMRLISEEKRLGTFELLVTCPLRDWSILLGKYLAALSAGAVILILSAAYPLTVQLISDNAAETPVILSSYLGMFFILAAYVAFGTFASSTTDNQMLAAILTFILLLSIYILAYINIGETVQVFGTVTLRQVFDGLSPVTHAENFSRGVFSLVNIAYFVFFISFFLIVAAKILEARRWRV